MGKLEEKGFGFLGLQRISPGAEPATSHQIRFDFAISHFSRYDKVEGSIPAGGAK